MKYHFGIKFLVFLLAVLMLLGMVGSAFSIIFLTENNLYRNTPEQWKSQLFEHQASGIADLLIRRYTAMYLGGLTREQMTFASRSYTDQDICDWYGVRYGSWDYWIRDLEGNLMENGVKLTKSDDLSAFRFTVTCDYPVHATAEESIEIEKTNTWSYRDYYYTETDEHFLYYYQAPTYYVYLRFQPDAVRIYTGIPQVLLDFLYNARYHMIVVLFLSLVLFVLSMTYLCKAAGRTPKAPDPKLRSINRLPLDLLLGVCGFGAVMLTAGAVVLAENNTITIYETAVSPLAVGLFALMLFAAGCLVVTFLYATAAQLKLKQGYWWRHSIIGWCLRKLWHGVRFCFRGFRKLYRMLPLVWQWLATAAAMVLIPLFCLLLAASTYGFFQFIFILWTIIAFLSDIAMVCYGAYAFGILYRGAKSMAKGNLQDKIPTTRLVGAFRGLAEEMNALADAAMVAAEKQMKSERMKTELITNISHDIKTPLTSIINYVDLLQAPHPEEDSQKYLDVLARQSQRMKKLIEDLMEMSKAASGNVQVEIDQVDVVEAVNQALGEFADKLTAARLTPIFAPPEHAGMIAADGRLVWRVLSNLLNNVVKYAMPGTRVYVDLVSLENRTQISLKNISAEPLNVSADELTERFVRGDASRNTEGSGLGLNIAQSLMDLQKGSLELLVDGDLFKVTLTFPNA